MSQNENTRIWILARHEAGSEITKLPIGSQPPLEHDGIALRWPPAATLVEVEAQLHSILAALDHCRATLRNNAIY